MSPDGSVRRAVRRTGAGLEHRVLTRGPGLGLAVGDPADIRAAHVPLPSEVAGDVLPRPAAQRYTRPGLHLYPYKGLFRRFTAGLPVDDPGLVLDYPPLSRCMTAPA